MECWIPATEFFDSKQHSFIWAQTQIPLKMSLYSQKSGTNFLSRPKEFEGSFLKRSPVCFFHGEFSIYIFKKMKKEKWKDFHKVLSAR